MRIVSLVPSVTDTLHALGVGDAVIGVTRYCTDGAPEGATRVGGTKNPDVQRILALRPDLVVVNTEENRAEDITRLRDAGVQVEELFPRAVGDVPGMLRALGSAVAPAGRGGAAEGTPLERAEAFAQQVESAVESARAAAPSTRVMALTLVWRKPWMGLGPDTYADDLLWTCGFGNVLSGSEERYPRLEEGLVLGQDVVLLPSEPYAFSEDDLEAVSRLAGADTPARFVDGQALTWHGQRTAAALATFSDLASALATATAGGRPTG